MDRAKLKATFEELSVVGGLVLNTRNVERSIPGVVGISLDFVDQGMCAEWGNRVVAATAAGFGKDHEFYSRAKELTDNPGETYKATQLLALVRAAAKCIDDGLLDEGPTALDALAKVELLCERFHSVAREIQGRHAGRETLTIGDEYDVQDLYRGMLKIFFEDVRPEEWTPSYAGGSARMDLLLKQELHVVELKMGRKGLGAKQLGDELLIDIGRYQVHPDCQTLVCFVYDPTGFVRNPAAIEGDLSKMHGDLKVRVLIRPRH